MTQSAQGNAELSIQMTNEFLKNTLGINKTLDQMYEEFVHSKRTKDSKCLRAYLKERNAWSNNPYHIYNQFYYHNGIPDPTADLKYTSHSIGVSYN